MAKPRQKTTKRKTRREKDHMLSVHVMSPRIVVHAVWQRLKDVSIYTLVTIVIALVLWGLISGARHLVLNGERFQLTSITMVPEPSERSFLNYSSLGALTGLSYGANVFSYDLGELEEVLETLPEVSSAKVARRYPGSIIVTIEEKEPVAKIESGNKVYYLDQSAQSFRSEYASATLAESVPYIIAREQVTVAHQARVQDVGVERALHLAQTWSKFVKKEQLRSITIVDSFSMVAMTSDGTELTFGYYEHDRQVKDYLSITYYGRKQGKTLLSANLIPEKNIPTKFDSAPEKSSQAKPAQLQPRKDILMILQKG